MKKIKVSVIVPVYNTQKYLKKCLDSLTNQTLKEIEIIVINDGSEEYVDDIISEYKDKIIYINNPHKGIGYTRNTGIKKASGEYIGFVDSDDYVSFDMFKNYYDYAKNNACDIVVGNYYRIQNKISNEELVPYFEINSIENNPKILTMIDYGPCNKIFNRELINKNKIFFEEKLKYEDMPFVSKTIKYANRIGHLNKAFYFYCVRGGSETNNFVKSNFDIFSVMNKFTYLFNKNHHLETEYVVVSKILDYNIQQRNNNNKIMRNEFIDKSNIYINEHFPNYKNNTYLKKEIIFKRLIKQNKFITKVYCNYYSIIRKIMIK